MAKLSGIAETDTGSKKRKADPTESTTPASTTKKARYELASPVVKLPQTSGGSTPKKTQEATTKSPNQGALQNDEKEAKKVEKKRRRAEQAKQKAGEVVKAAATSNPALGSSSAPYKPSSQSSAQALAITHPADESENVQRKRERKAEKKARRALEKAENDEALGDRELDRQLATLDTAAIAARVHAEVAALGLPVRAWQLSYATGGRYISQAPIFAREETTGLDVLIIATTRDVQVLNLETSLVVRRCAVDDGLSIKSIVLVGGQSASTSVLRAVCMEGEVFEWEWMSDNASMQKVNWGGEGHIKMVACSKDGELWYLQRSGRSDLIGNAKPQHMTEQRLDSLFVLGDTVAEFVVAYGISTVVIGMRKDVAKEKHEYIWLELPFSSALTCLDARLTYQDEVSSTSNSKTSKRRPTPHLTLAVGQSDGQIHLYTDLNSLFSRNKDAIQTPAPRVLHWHRTAPSTVKFSPDGHYLISGGAETVLVLWQLATGKQQFLPHLGAEIEEVGISPTGERYAIVLGSNSVVVLSSGTLQAVASVGGLQLSQDLAAPRGKLKAGITSGADRRPISAVLHPLQPTQLLLPAATTQPKAMTEAALARPWLQTFDLRSGRHVARQALTRTSITDFNRGPEGDGIVDPDVNLLATCRMAKDPWMASVESWLPAAGEVERFATTGDDDQSNELEVRVGSVQAERLARREVALRFWRWDEQQGVVAGGGSWALNTKVSAPHARSIAGATGDGKVLALLSAPAGTDKPGFVSIGEDRVVRFWKCKPTSKSEAGGMKWVCEKSVKLSCADGKSERVDSPFAADEDTEALAVPSRLPAEPRAVMAISQDGSLLVVALHSNGETLVHFIDTRTGSIRNTKTAAHILGSTSSNTKLAQSFTVRQIALVDRYLVILSSALQPTVWDLVSDSLYRRYPHISTSKTVPREEIQTQLAVNFSDVSFAVALETEVVAYSIANNEKKFAYRSGMGQSEVVALLANGEGGHGGKGYVVVYEDATTRNLIPPQTSRFVTRSSDPVAMALLQQQGVNEDLDDDATAIDGDTADVGMLALPGTDAHDNNVDLSSALLSDTPRADPDAMVMTAQHERPVVRPEQLATIFDTEHSHAMMPVKEMFERVIELFAPAPAVSVR
ncbi:hypothetical protein LTR62_004149 [Meristemomyces frigidus]|uniref:WD40 repeat-like protein n=1 Tax=Meristemomyces frigidus TaxID=1508187 RepID=A0AAN7YN89_9PEZI|nr:hypothetical protein LTR62_004149 [Meristemomyces frigidus]